MSNKLARRRGPVGLSVDDLPMPAVVLDRDGALSGANSRFRDLAADDVAPVGLAWEALVEAANARLIEQQGRPYVRFVRAGGDRSFHIRRSERPSGGSLLMLDEVTGARERFERRQITDVTQRQLMLTAEVGAWRYDPDARIYIFPNELSLGHEGSGQPVSVEVLQRMQHPDDREKDTEIRERITREGGAAEAEMRYVGADGGWRTLRVLYRAGMKLPSGLYEMYGLSQNVTSLARARDEAAAIAQRLDLALKASGAGVFEYDFKADTIWASSELHSLMGDEAVARANTDPFYMFHPADRPAAKELRRRAVAGLGNEPADVRLQRPDGDVWVRLYYEVEHGADGAPRRGVGLIIDIDGAKRQEIAVGEARMVAEAATEAKSDFLASVSHEIRTPMNGIVGVLNLLKREELSRDGRGLLDEALGCTEMLSQLINDVLDFSKIEAGKLAIDPAPSCPVAIADSVANLVRPQAEAKGLTLDVRSAADIGWVEIDPVRLRQCLFNLIGNAVKFTETGGIEVRLSMSGAGADRRLRCEVQDTGIGVPDDARERLFGRFQQVESGSARRFGGTGLGLAISRQLARLMGGDLDYVSREGEGSTFWFEIAAPPAVRPSDEAAVEMANTPLAGLTVLVVDDNRVNRLVAVKSLEAMGAEATAVESGPEAIEAVRLGGLDLVLMDVNMPGMDGLEATRRIRAWEATAHAGRIPIVALTADVMRRQYDAYIASGMDGMAPKPFSPMQLMTEILRIAGETPEPEEALRA
ncbi:MAG TPA: ATP-binding protein [Caulobacteraceae bacterium]|jgi:signal transduction histidine kinase/AmiR/NasT family two-component response regulator